MIWNRFDLSMIVPTVESYLGTIQKHQELIFSRYPQQLMLCTYPGPQYFLNFLACRSLGKLSENCTTNLHCYVTSGENLTSTGCQMHPQGFHLSVKVEKTLCRKLGWGYTNLPIYFVNFVFSTSFCVFNFFYIYLFFISLYLFNHLFIYLFWSAVMGHHTIVLAVWNFILVSWHDGVKQILVVTWS